MSVFLIIRLGYLWSTQLGETDSQVCRAILSPSCINQCWPIEINCSKSAPSSEGVWICSHEAACLHHFIQDSYFCSQRKVRIKTNGGGFLLESLRNPSKTTPPAQDIE